MRFSTCSNNSLRDLKEDHCVSGDSHFILGTFQRKEKGMRMLIDQTSPKDWSIIKLNAKQGYEQITRHYGREFEVRKPVPISLSAVNRFDIS